MSILKNSDKQILKSFAVGKNLRLFLTNENNVYKCYNFDKEQTSNISKLTDVNLSGHYFLRDKTYIDINSESMFPPAFIDKAKESAHEPDTNPKSEVYYNTDNIDLDYTKGFLQYNNRCYFMDTNSYQTENENVYAIETFKSIPSTLYDLSAYVSQKYDAKYFDDAQLVDNKAIPIYDINEDALNRISFIKFSNVGNISKFLNDHNLNSVASSLLFNSKYLEMNPNDYDSIFVDELLNVIAENPDLDEKQEMLFDDLFSNLDKESFLRMFNPIGQIRSIRNEKYSLNENEYLYSLNLSTPNALYDIPLNYFSLKNLKSPELYQNYHLININENKSVKTEAYNLKYNITAKILTEFINVVIKGIYNYIIEKDLVISAGKNISDELLNDIIYTIIDRYPLYTKNDLLNRFEKISTSYLDDEYFYKGFFYYCFNKYGINIKENTSSITKNDLVIKLNDLYNSFKITIKPNLDALSEIDQGLLINSFNSFIKNIMNSIGLKNDDWRSPFIDNHFIKTVTAKPYTIIDKEGNFDNNLIKYVETVIGDDDKQNPDVFVDGEKIIYYDLNKYEISKGNSISVELTKFNSIIYNIDVNMNSSLPNGITIISSIYFPYLNTICTNRELSNIDSYLTSFRINGFDLISNLEANHLFQPEIYKVFIEPLLNEVGKIDAANFIIPNEMDLLNFKERMSTKIDSYLSIYDNMFEHENEFKLSGYLYGYRTYDSCFKNTINDMYLTYDYDTTIDLNFLSDNLPDSKIKRMDSYDDLINDLSSDGKNLSSMISGSDLYIIPKNSVYNVITSFFGTETYAVTIEENKLNAEFVNDKISLKSRIMIYEILGQRDYDWIDSPFGKLEIFKIAENEYAIMLGTSIIGKYLDTLYKMKNIEFCERIEGEHYYRELEKSKSNVFSLRVKNSGLSYNLYSYDEVKHDFIERYKITQIDGNKFIFNDREYTFKDLLIRSNYYKFIEDEHTYYDEVKDDAITDDNEFKGFKYFKCDGEDANDVDYMRKLIKSKIHVRNTFNASIRKSIHRYMPVNTTLWKIDYQSDY